MLVIRGLAETAENGYFWLYFWVVLGNVLNRLNFQFFNMIKMNKNDGIEANPPFNSQSKLFCN